MGIYDIIWLDAVVEKLWKKHGVTTLEAEQVLLGTPSVRFIEKGKVRDEHMYAAFGRTDAGRYLTVFFIKKKNNHALIISSRDMTRTERKLYEKK